MKRSDVFTAVLLTAAALGLLVYAEAARAPTCYKCGGEMRPMESHGYILKCTRDGCTGMVDTLHRKD